jgi:exonuclease SbcD
MRIIHTADWHLCDRLDVRRINRTADLRKRVEIIAGLCEEHMADVLLIAGDLFSEEASIDEMTDALKHIRETFASFFARGGTILAITGNHDRDGRINMVRAGMTLAAPAAGQDGRLPHGRMYLANGRAVATLESAGGFAAQFVLVPYPFPSRYDLSASEYRTKEEENRLLHGLVAEYVQSVAARPGFDPRLPTVLAAHLHVRGAEVHSLYKLTERDDVVFDPGFLPSGWAYVALGHIHKPQALNGLTHVRYPGSLDRLDFGETHDGHGVWLIDIGPTGLRGDPQHLPIPATPFHTAVLTDPKAELPQLAERFPDRETAIVRVTVAHAPAGPSRDEVARELRRLFPRLAGLTWDEPARATSAGCNAYNPRAGFETTVRDFLNERLKDDPDKDELMVLAERFLAVGDES